MPETTPRLVAAQVTLHFEDGSTQQYALDTEETPIELLLDVTNDAHELPLEGVYRSFQLGSRRKVLVCLSGRGPLPQPEGRPCGATLTEPGVKGIWVCRLEPGHDGAHSSGAKSWTAPAGAVAG